MKPSRLLGAALLAGAALLPAAVRAADYPAKPITLIVPFPAGSGTDAVGRIFGNELSSILGQQVIVENKPGANATIAANLVARAPRRLHDLRHHQHLALGRALADEERALRPREGLHAHRARRQPALHPGRQPQTALENGRRPGRRCAPAPRRITYASGNNTGIVAGATLARRANIDILHVPYKGTPQGLTDVVGGQVDFMFTDLASGLPFVQSGQLRALAVSTAQRSAIVPDLPSMAESGVPDFDLNSWNGYFGPAGLPPEVVARLNAAINQVVAKPETRQRLAALGFDAFSGTPQDFARFVGEQRDLWGKLIRDAGIEQQ